jgi:hypothetical protein
MPADLEDVSIAKTLAIIMKAINAYTPLVGAQYETDKKAHFLDYMAQECPYKYIPYNLCVRAVQGLSRTPAVNSDAVDQFRKSMSSVRRKLLKTYNRDIDPLQGVGIRASVDEADRLRHHQRLRGRIVTAVGNAVAHAATIDADKIKDQKLRAGFVESRKALGGTSESVTRLMKLLPPKPEDKKKP